MSRLAINGPEADSVLARFDARLKLGFSLVLILLCITYKGFLFPLSVAAVSLCLMLIGGVGPKTIFKRLLEPLFIVTMLVLLKTLFGSGEELFSTELLGIRIAGHMGGLWEGLLIAARVLGAVTVVSLLGFSTSFTELLGALAWFRVPWTFVEILMYCHRFLFMLLQEAEVIYSSQKNRLGYAAGIRHGLNSFGILGGALVLKAFDQSQSLSTAMLHRGYNGRMPVFSGKAFKRAEVLGFLFLCMVFTAFWGY